MRAALGEVSRAVAKGVVFVHGEGAADRISVVVNPSDQQQRQKTREAQKRKSEDTDRIIVERLEELERFRGMGREEAKRYLARDKTNDWSYWRIDRAITSQNKIRNPS
jgi:hypothetical protein